MLDLARSQRFRRFLGCRQRLRQFILWNRERHLGRSPGTDILDDHVDRNLPLGHLGEDDAHHSGTVGNAHQADPGLALGQRHARHHRRGVFGFRGDQRPFARAVGRTDKRRHAILLRELDRPRMHHPRTQTRQLQHLVVRNPRNLAGLGNLPRIGREHAFDVRVNLAHIRLEHRRQRDRRRIAPAPAQRRDVQLFVDALEPGRNDHLSAIERLPHPLGGDRPNSGLGVGRVGHNADLAARHAHGLLAQLLHGHRQQRHRFLLARRQEHIHLAGRRFVGDLFGQFDQFVCLVPAGTDDDHHLMTGPPRIDDPLGGRKNLGRVGDTRAAKLLHNQRHDNPLPDKRPALGQNAHCPRSPRRVKHALSNRAPSARITPRRPQS